MIKILTQLYCCLLIAILPASSVADDFDIEQVMQLPGVPWGLDFVDQQTIIYTLRSGTLGLLDITRQSSATVSGLPAIATGGQGGLLDIAIAPDFQNNSWLYLTYSKTTDKGAVTTLARSQLDNGRLVNWQDLLVSDSASGTGRHFGSRIAFDGQGHVFFSIGDRGVRENAQNTRNHSGSIIRLTLDGQIPADNPFVDQPAIRDEIWSYGHRNPQGLVFDPETKKLWSIEHGPRGGDEINLVKKGHNYGWPVISHGKEYWAPLSVGEGTEKPGMESPLKVYVPSIAPGSLIVYRGDAFPAWQNSLLAGALKLQHINRVPILSGNRLGEEQRLLENLNERIRAIVESPDGLIYFSTDSGKIMRIKPAR